MNKNKLTVIFSLLMISTFFLNISLIADEVEIIDSRHYSNVFGEMRNFRVFLPPDYNSNSEKEYPVIYYYHGWSQRYFGSGPNSYSHIEKGDDNEGDNIANFVATHDVIVVKPDGYNRSSGEEYYLRPYNVLPVETFRQFPLYFPELVDYIDDNFRTIPDRNHRAISGLSMGGFMSFWVGGKYPHLVSAIGNFCGSAEFVVGPKDFPVEYRNLDMYKNYAGINVRLNYGNEDFIRYYHRDMNKVWTQVMDNYEYKVYNAAHSTCGLGEMFEFIMKTFDDPPEKPEKWDHIDVYPEFSVWDYNVSSDRDVPGFTVLENVDKGGFRCTVREHLPDGEVMPYVNLTVTTAPVYEKNQSFVVNDFDYRTLNATQKTLKSDNAGRLKIDMNGGDHEIGINSNSSKVIISMASFSVENMKHATIGMDVTLKVKLLNKGVEIGERIKATLSATRKSVDIIKEQVDFGQIGINELGESENNFKFRVQADTVEIERFRLTITDKYNNEWVDFFEVPLIRNLPESKEFEIADGRLVTVVKEGVKTETVILGSGNGDGVANPGESIVILIKDLDKLWRTSLKISDQYVNPKGINIRVSDFWGSYDHVGGSAKYSVPLISSNCPEDYVIGFVAEYWLPDYPNHIIKQKKVSVKVRGKDNTPPEMQWVRIPGDNVIQTRIYDGSPIQNVTAKLILRDDSGKFLDFVLLDNGKEGDKTKDDNVFSYTIPEQRFGLYQVEITATDSFGNVMVRRNPDIFVLH